MARHRHRSKQLQILCQFCFLDDVEGDFSSNRRDYRSGGGRTIGLAHRLGCRLFDNGDLLSFESRHLPCETCVEKPYDKEYSSISGWHSRGGKKPVYVSVDIKEYAASHGPEVSLSWVAIELDLATEPWSKGLGQN